MFDMNTAARRNGGLHALSANPNTLNEPDHLERQHTKQ